MNTNTTEALLIEIARDLKSNAEQAKSFVIEQAPDVIQQVLVYNFWSSLFFAFVLLVLVMCFVSAGMWGYEKFKGRNKDYMSEEAWCVIPICSVLFGLVVFSLACGKLNTCLKIKLAPKVYIIEYASNLIK